jgi:cyclin B
MMEETEMINIYGYMKFQSDLNEKMRATLIDWIIEVHYKFKLSHETLFLCVHLIDKYLSQIAVDRKNLQLIGITALMISCKYEEIYSPELKDFIYVTDKAYSGEDILQLEFQMLRVFKFDITVPTSFKIFQIISQNLNLTDKDICIGKYLLELFMMDYRSVKYKPSIIATSVCYLVMRIGNYDNYINVYDYLKYEKSIMKECIRDICFIHEYIGETGIISVKRKYMNETFYRVANVKLY